mgnify:CR=1 FL=1
MFGLGLLEETAIALTGDMVIGLVIKEACKQMKNKKNHTINNNSTADTSEVNGVDEK